MARFAVLIHAADSAHAPETGPEDRAEPDGHAEELLSGGVIRALAADLRASSGTPGVR